LILERRAWERVRFKYVVVEGATFMATNRQNDLKNEFLRALRKFGEGTSTEYLVAATSDQSKADPNEITEALAAVTRDERTEPKKSRR
jgi:hypothetical protein